MDAGLGTPSKGSLPLAGRIVVVTRPEEQAESLAGALRALGATVQITPTIRVERVNAAPSLDETAANLSDFDWAIFTSRNAVRFFSEAIGTRGRSFSDLGRCRVCVVGPATAEAVVECGGIVDLVAGEHRAEGVVAELAARREVEGRRILYPRAEGARPVIAESLREQGAAVTELVVYRSVADASGIEQLRRLVDGEQVDYLTFLSSSAVEAFVVALGTRTGGAAVAAIGPVTAATARKLGLQVAVEARPYTVSGLATRLAAHAIGHRSG